LLGYCTTFTIQAECVIPDDTRNLQPAFNPRDALLVEFNKAENDCPIKVQRSGLQQAHLKIFVDLRSRSEEVLEDCSVILEGSQVDAGLTILRGVMGKLCVRLLKIIGDRAIRVQVCYTVMMM
jgi:hypothetical protein